jgi:hypothetical protein
MQPKIMLGKLTIGKYSIMACVRLCAVWGVSNTCRLTCILVDLHNFYIYTFLILVYVNSLIFYFLISFVQECVRGR